MKNIELKKRLITSLLLLTLFLLVFVSNIILIYCLIVASVLALIEFINIIKKIVNNKIFLIFFNFSFIIYISIFSFSFFYFSNFIQLKFILFSLLLGCIASDIGGFVFGKTFKGPKLTKISPNKTISGFFGSIVFTNIFFSTSIFFFTKNFSYEILLIGTISSIACQTGDLFFSFLKRKAKIKDTGKFLPGHGGILDRLDGILLGIPIGFISLMLIF